MTRRQGLYLVSSTGQNEKLGATCPASTAKSGQTGALGSVSKVSLSNARKIATANLAAIQKGTNPFEAGYLPPVKETATLTPTFADAVNTVYALNVAEWGEKTAKLWLRRLEIHTFEALADSATLPRSPVRTLPILLSPLRVEHHETARKLQQSLAKVFRWARAHDYRTDDPADDALGELVKKVKHVPEHHKALPYREVGRGNHAG